MLLRRAIRGEAEDWDPKRNAANEFCHATSLRRSFCTRTLPFVRHPEYEDFSEEDWLYRGHHRDVHPAYQDDGRLVRDNVISA